VRPVSIVTADGSRADVDVSIIIPHYLGDVLSDCLKHIFAANPGPSVEVIVVDDQPRVDGSIACARAAFPSIRIVKTSDRHGFGAACNAGLLIARGKYVAILNNDALVAPDWLEPLIAAGEANPEVGVFQAKIRSHQHPERFDYSGAAGGMMDLLGFPFAFGRMFDAIEEDRGQYDVPRDIFWAVGTGMFIRRSCLEATGAFDEAFYMHMEEIDLCWRMRLAGFRVRSCPKSVIYHRNGFTLKPGSFRKAYLNHRNNVVLLLKNLPWSRVAWVLPLRVLLLAALALFGLMRRDWKHPLAAALGVTCVGVRALSILRRRAIARRVRRVPDSDVLAALHPGSIVMSHFVLGASTASDVIDSTPRLRRPRMSGDALLAAAGRPRAGVVAS
jgi:GT2 family glycosyltransferase